MRKAVAIAVITGASLFLVSRFERSPDGALLEARFDAEPAAIRPGPITPVETTTTTSTTAPPPTTTTQSAAPTTDDTGVATTTTVVPTSTTSTTTTTTEPPSDRIVAIGPAMWANWGYVQVQIAVEDGVIVEVSMRRSPKGTKRSKAISREVEPILTEQALERQSPWIDAISGATVTTYAFHWSLRNLLNELEMWTEPPEGYELKP